MKLSELKKIVGHAPRLEDPEEYRKWQTLIRSLGLDPENMYQELEMTSRYVDTHRDESRSNNAVQLHSHTFYEVIYCRNSCDVEYLVGSVRYRLQRGDIVLVPPGVSHRPILPETMTEPYKRYVLWISEEFLQKAATMVTAEKNWGGLATNLIRTAGTPWEFLGGYFRNGVRESEEKQPGWELAVAGNTAMLLVQIQRALQDSKVRPMPMEKPELLDQVMAYVEKNLGRKITLAETARHFYVSESTVSQLFRKKMGVSFYRCVTQRRLIAAKTLIEGDVAMEDVSRQVGFSDYSAFYRAFRQEYGISPRQYRKLREDQKRADTRSAPTG